MKIILLGAPGCGKGTQAVKIQNKFGINHVSSGDLFRAAISSGTPIGNLAKEYMNKGQLVPDNVTIELVKSTLQAKIDDGSLKNGFMLDGFPRTLDQAKELQKFMDIDLVLYFEISNDKVLERIAKRKFCSKCKENYVAGDDFKTCTKCGGEIVRRDDDNPEVAKKRLEVYGKQTFPLIEYYKELGILKTINADQPQEKVEQDINVLLGEV